MICLDSSIAIAILRGARPDVEERLARAFVKHSTLAMSSIVLMELRYGVVRAQNSHRSGQQLDRLLKARFEILPFTPADAERAAYIRADLAKRGLTIGPFDVLIAAQALERDLTLITNNTREFSRISDLKLEDWL